MAWAVLGGKKWNSDNGHNFLIYLTFFMTWSLLCQRVLTLPFENTLNFCTLNPALVKILRKISQINKDTLALFEFHQICLYLKFYFVDKVAIIIISKMGWDTLYITLSISFYSIFGMFLSANKKNVSQIVIVLNFFISSFSLI